MVLAVASVTAAVVMAPVAAAAPTASTRADHDAVPDVRHAQIITPPPAMNNGPWYGWPYVALRLDLGW